MSRRFVTARTIGFAALGAVLFVAACATAEGGDVGGPSCGNGRAEGSEMCDGADLRGQSCASRGFASGGDLTCNASCTGFVTSDCTGSASNAVCGNGVLEGGETCDGANFGTATCASMGFSGGILGCRPGCASLDTTLCTTGGGGSSCGNGVVDGTEVCDGFALGGQTCAGQGYDGGTLGCLPGCNGFDTSGCTAGGGGGSACGDGFADFFALEICDGSDLAGETCASQGFAGGTLACLPDCSGYNTSGCSGTFPAEWSCPTAYYGVGDGCDCGCGAIDPDCADATSASCEYCDDSGSCGTGTCPANIDPTQNWLCTGGGGGGVPVEWTCSTSYYDTADGCDCGCGALDPDCLDASSASCDWCDDLGSCGTGTCPANIDPTQNWLCI